MSGVRVGRPRDLPHAPSSDAIQEPSCSNFPAKPKRQIHGHDVQTKCYIQVHVSGVCGGGPRNLSHSGIIFGGRTFYKGFEGDFCTVISGDLGVWEN